MKFFSTFALVVLIFNCTSAVLTEEKDGELKGFIEDLVNNTLNGILADLPESIVVSNVSIPFEGAPLEGHLAFEKLQVEGLKELVATEIEVQLVGMHLNMTVLLPELRVTVGRYDLNLLVLDIVPLYGKGDISVDLQNVQVEVSGGLNITGGMSIKDIKAVLTLGNAVFSVTGLLDNYDFSILVSEILNDVVVPFINDNTEVISNVISPILETIINSILNPDTTTTSAPTTPVTTTTANPTTPTTTTPRTTTTTPNTTTRPTTATSTTTTTPPTTTIPNTTTRPTTATPSTTARPTTPATTRPTTVPV